MTDGGEFWMDQSQLNLTLDYLIQDMNSSPMSPIALLDSKLYNMTEEGHQSVETERVSSGVPEDSESIGGQSHKCQTSFQRDVASST